MKSFAKLFILSLIVITLSSFDQQSGYVIDGSINVSSGTIYLKNFRNKTFFNFILSKRLTITKLG